MQGKTLKLRGEYENLPATVSLTTMKQYLKNAEEAANRLKVRSSEARTK